MTEHKIQSLIANDYDLIAREEFLMPTSRLHDDAILRELPLNCNIVLDIGCGTGEFTNKLSGRSKWIKGIDVSPVSIQVARERYGKSGIEFDVATINDICKLIEPHSCSAIVANRVLHHCTDLRKIIGKLFSFLEPGGSLIILDLNCTGDAIPRWHRFLVMIFYRTSVLIKGLLEGKLLRTISDLCAEKKAYRSRGWRQHLSHEPNYNWRSIRDALLATGTNIRYRRLNFRFLLFIASPGNKTKGEHE